MSTAEQIIAEHRWSALTDACKCGDPTISWGAHAAHVVAALTNAGKTIVEQDAEAKAFDLAADVVHAEARWQHEQDRRGTVGAQIVAQRMLVMEGVIRRFAAETREALAAARVAEVGDQP